MYGTWSIVNQLEIDVGLGFDVERIVNVWGI